MVNNLSVLKLLFRYDVDPCAKNTLGETPSAYYARNCVGPDRNSEACNTFCTADEENEHNNVFVLCEQILEFLSGKEAARELEKVKALRDQFKQREREDKARKSAVSLAVS